MADRFPDERQRKPFWPAVRWYRVTPHDTNQLPNIPVYLRVNAAGVLRIKNAEGDDVTEDVGAGEIIDARVEIVHTDTTAVVTAYW